MEKKTDDDKEGRKEMKSLMDTFEESFSRYARKTSITFIRQGHVETELSYEGITRETERLARCLLKQGVNAGDRVILFLPKSLSFVVAHLATQKIGAIGVPLNPGFKKAEMAYFVEDAGPRLIIVGRAQEDMIREITPHHARMVIDTGRPYQDLEFGPSAAGKLPEVATRPDDPALIIYTSGTTGKPKGAVLTHRNLVHDAQNIIGFWEISDQDVLCHALPLFHVHGLCFALHTALMAGAHVVMLDEFSPEIVITILADKNAPYVCTVFMAVPSMYATLLNAMKDKKRDFSHMRLWTSGSAPLLPKDFERIRDVFGQEPVEREGMSETGMNFSNPLRGIRKPGSIGIPFPGLQVRLVDPATLKDVASGATGEIWLKGPGITPGYWGKPEEILKTFVEGWFRTGDLGHVDRGGYYYLTDRIKHIIISGGENISPKEIEGMINRLPGVMESSVVGIPDEKWGEKVVAAVVSKPGARLEATTVQNHCKEHLHNWKCPKEIVFVKELPRNTMGKVLKEEVKRLFG